MGGSPARTGLATIVVVAFAMADADPILQLFTWLSGVAAVGVVLLMAGTSAAVVGYFSAHPDAANRWQRTVAPAAATVVLLALVALLVATFDALLGSDQPPGLRWLLPGLVLLAAAVGAAGAVILRIRRPDVYADIGGTVPIRTYSAVARVSKSASTRASCFSPG